MARHYIKAEDKPLPQLRKLAATALQKCIRAEAAAKHGDVQVISQTTGAITVVHAPRGYLACITCGKVLPYFASKQAGDECMDAGHYLSRKYAATLLDERNIHPQCNFCNQYASGVADLYDHWMFVAYGRKEVDKLRMKRNTGDPPKREECLRVLKEARRRTREAEKRIRLG